MFYITQPAFKDKLNRNYRARALDSHLRSVPIFRNLSADFLEHLRDRVELVDAVPGQVICRQGEIADSFYLIRMGFVKVSQIFPGGELVLTYLSRSSYFGEMGLLPPVFRVRARGLKPGNIAEAAVSDAKLTVGRVARHYRRAGRALGRIYLARARHPAGGGQAAARDPPRLRQKSDYVPHAAGRYRADLARAKAS